MLNLRKLSELNKDEILTICNKEHRMCSVVGLFLSLLSLIISILTTISNGLFLLNSLIIAFSILATIIFTRNVFVKLL